MLNHTPYANYTLHQTGSCSRRIGRYIDQWQATLAASTPIPRDAAVCDYAPGHVSAPGTSISRDITRVRDLPVTCGLDLTHALAMHLILIACSENACRTKLICGKIKLLSQIVNDILKKPYRTAQGNMHAIKHSLPGPTKISKQKTAAQSLALKFITETLTLILGIEQQLTKINKKICTNIRGV